ncbi:haloacid dehalogenase-like hydrolase [Halosquirtibacter xylanolyticus]|uniref:HAD family hydrolase n=1 Tax=Halosquirtibacter xylanolyticus TaxID=3374599 RepID=UPI00374A3793|nr:haloacid dehalogenase-like hydrolase [Prolixibacteraceae bacterium]
MNKILFGITLFCFISCQYEQKQPVEPSADLASWNDNKVKKRIVEFVNKVTTPGSDTFVPIEDRIAVFDNDGTLWSEKPLYSHFYGVFYRVEQLIKEHPEKVNEEPFKSLHQFILSKSMKDLHFFMEEYKEGKMLDIVGQLMGSAFSGMKVEEYEMWNRTFFSKWRNNKLDRTIFQMTYQPMKELIDFLKKSGFKVYIITADEGDFLKLFSRELYGVDPSHVFGTTTALKYDEGILYRTSKGQYVNNWDGKPRLIKQAIGKRPIVAAGNSNGDFHMLEYTHKGEGQTLSILIHHTDAKREFQYDGHTDKVLPYAHKNGYVVVDMQQDWANVFGD